MRAKVGRSMFGTIREPVRLSSFSARSSAGDASKSGNVEGSAKICPGNHIFGSASVTAAIFALFMSLRDAHTNLTSSSNRFRT